jgi:hypothetical protein
MTQPNVFETSAPAAPGGNAPFVSATTAPKSLVFRPGATFPPGGIGVQQNVFTTPVSSGTDGLVMLQGILQGTGVFPAVPLPSSTIELDFSLNGDSFDLTSNLNLGADPSLVGLTNQATNIQPQLDTSGFTISPILSIENLTVTVSAATAVTTSFRSFSLVNSTLQSSDGHLYATLPNSGTTTITVRNSTIGDGSNPVLAAPAGCNLTLNLYDQSTLNAGAITVNPAAVVIIMAWPGSVVDSSYIGMAGVIIESATLTLPIVAGTGTTAVGGLVALGTSCHAQGTSSQAIGTNCLSTAINSRTGGNGAHTNYSGSDAFAASRRLAIGDNQVEWVQATGSTPGLAVGESVDLLIGGTDPLTLMGAHSPGGFTVEMHVIATGTIGGVAVVQSFVQYFSCLNNGLPSIQGSTTQQQFGSNTASSWTFAVAFSNVGTNHLAMTFTTGATTSNTFITASVKLVSAS